MANESIRIAVIADTHDKLPLDLVERIAGADEIWHLGDVCGEWVLDELRGLGKTVKVVRGNCDSVTEWPVTLDFTRGGLRIRLVHVPPSDAPRGIDLVLHGHTHVPRNERVGGTVFLNPGCVTRPNQGAQRSFAWLTIERDGGWRWELGKFLTG